MWILDTFFILRKSDLEETFDGVPRDAVWWDLRIVGVDERLVKIVQSISSYSWSFVIVNGVFSDDFLVSR